jgi:hypothetical protein
MKIALRIVKMPIIVSWNELDEVVINLSRDILSDGPPDLIVGLLRGGLVPSVILAHRLNIRDIVAINVHRTVSDEIDAAKTAPQISDLLHVESLVSKDILVVDDVAGTGVTMRTIQDMLGGCSPRRLRTLVCFLNREKWDISNVQESHHAISYIGKEVREWVVFPWEKSL